jgi:hypothetical protein
VQIFHDFSDSNTKPRPKRQPCSQWLAGTVDLSESEIFDVGFEAEIGRGMRQISPFVCRIFFWESTKMYSGDEHHFITFDPLSSEKRYI